MLRFCFKPWWRFFFFFGWLFLFPVPGSAADLSLCEKNPDRLQDMIRCALWQVAGFMHPDQESRDLRTTGPVDLGPNRWVLAEAAVNESGSPWPEFIRLKFYHGQAANSSLVEVIKDAGLDGLSLEDAQDEYLRFLGQGQANNLLAGLDPKLIEPLNRDYLTHLRAVLGMLEQRPVHGPIAWREISPGLELALVQAFRSVRLGENELVLLRLDPQRFEMVPLSYKEEAGGEVTDVLGWAEKNPQAAAIFNSGQYYPDYRYIGLQLKDGRDYGTGLHPVWKALLLSGLKTGREDQPLITILDLDFQAFDHRRSDYRYALQSFMLLDRTGRLRVRPSDSLASRTVLAQDLQGRMLVILAPGACTLHDLAWLLKKSDLGIKQAMGLDGGFESQLLVRQQPRDLVVNGAWVVNERRQFHYQGLRLPLPAVVAVYPRSTGPD
ncbi:MAG: phosphodiester glycosidase family protein [Pseudomonadota bacterium]